MGQRLELQSLLEGLLGSRAVYFQPPPSFMMSYPCVVYERDYADTKHADNEVYDYVKRYQISVIDRDPDSEIPDKIAHLPQCLFVRHYVVDGLNHDVFNIYF